MPFQVSPTDGGKVLYGIGSKLQLVGGIPCSYDQGDSWSVCWANKRGLSGYLNDLIIKNESVLLVLRADGNVPLRSVDGGDTWQPMISLAAIAPFIHSLAYSWSGKTLAMLGSGGTQSAVHPHASYVWRSLDDGDTWTDETADIVTQGAGISQWYGTELYLSSGGQGIMMKTMEGV